MGFPMGIPIWDGNGNDFKPMGIPTCGFCGFFCGFLWVFLWVFVGFPVGFCGFLWVFPQKSCGNGMGMGIQIPFPRQPW